MPQNDPEFMKVINIVLAALSTLFIGLLSWVGTRQVGRIDKIEKRVLALEENKVTSKDIDKLGEDIGLVHKRVDDIYKILTNKA